MSKELFESSATILPVAAAALLTKSASLSSLHARSTAKPSDKAHISQRPPSNHDMVALDSQHIITWVQCLLKRLVQQLMSKTRDPCKNHTHSHSHHTRKEFEEHQKQMSDIKKRANAFSFWSTAEIVTLETKYHVVPWVAEFWCTMTSVFFALPAILYMIPMIPSSVYVQSAMSVDALIQWAPWIFSHPLRPLLNLLLACAKFDPNTISSFAHLYIVLSTIVAITSTVYHCTLWNVCSVLDVLLATVAFWANTMYMCQDFLPFNAFINTLISTTCIGTIFFYHFEKHTEIAVLAFALGVPPAIYGYIQNDCLIGSILGAIGLTCFMMDRTKMFMSHSLWHIFGGMSMACGVLVVELFR